MRKRLVRPRNPNEYRYRSGWEPMRVVRESIPVRGGPASDVELKFTRHGPVILEDAEHHRAYALRAAWLDTGGAPYFGSMLYLRAKNLRQFTAALKHWDTPGENHVYADTHGRIGWFPAGFTPIRPNTDGLLPLPGDGRYEWDGYLDRDLLPSEIDPDRGYIATANQMNLPADYPYAQRRINFSWPDDFRFKRISEILDDHRYEVQCEMRAQFLAVLLICIGSNSSLCLAARAGQPDFAGHWNVTVTFADASVSSVLELQESEGKYIGSSGPLNESGYMRLTYAGTVTGARLQLTATVEGLSKVVAAPQSVGMLIMEMKNARLTGQGTLYGVAVSLAGVRADKSVRAPETHNYVPSRYITTLSPRNQPVLHLNPGDSVRTTTVDAYGLDEKRQWAWMPGNPHTGPFYIEGAMPGDTLVVHLTRVRVNQARAAMVCGGLNTNALPAHLVSKADFECDPMWILDAAGGFAAPSTPSPKLKNFRVPLRPMVGSIGVAPASNEAITAADLKFHGGNLDYNRIVEGTTLYLPVFHAGALFSLGDGHAAQGDGEITGQGLETSLSVEFKVALIKGKAPRFPWSEDADYVMFSGIGNTVNEALQAATAGMVDWLQDRYQLGTADIAMILGTSIEYDIAEIVDARPHVVAKLRKDVLRQVH